MATREKYRLALSDFFREGRMLGASKRAPEGHRCVSNANIFTRESGKIWFGDLDLTAEAAELVALASRLGEELYVLREHDGRFQRENNPNWSAAVARVTYDGVVLAGGQNRG